MLAINIETGNLYLQKIRRKERLSIEATSKVNINELLTNATTHSENTHKHRLRTKSFITFW
jgi:hypothetical protein